MTRACLVAVIVVLAGWAGATAGATGDADVALVLVDQRFGLEPDARWTATLMVDGPLEALIPTSTTTTSTTTTAPADPATPATPPSGTAAPPAVEPVATIRVSVHRAIRDRVELASALEDDPPDVIDAVSAPLPTLTTSTGGDPTITVDVPTTATTDTEDALALRRPGLYPLTVAVVVDGDVVAEHRTFVERLPAGGDTGAAMQVALLAAIPDPGPVPTPAERRDSRAALAAIAETAGAVDGPMSVALPPVLLDGLAAEDPDLAESLQTALAGDEVLAMPENVLDPSSAVAIGAGDVFSRELVQGVDASNAVLPGSPARRSSWLVDESISTDAAVMLRDLGFGMLVMAADTYAELDGTIASYLDTSLTFDVDLGGAGALPGIVRAGAGALLDTELLEASGTSPADGAVRIMAELVTTRRELGAELRRGVVMTTPSLAAPDSTAADHLATFVGEVPPFALAPLSAVPSATDTMELEGGPHQVGLPAVAGPDLRERAARIDLTRVSAGSSGSMFLDDAQQQEWMAELDTLLSTGISDAAADIALARISAEAQAVRDAVQAPRPFTFTLTGRESEVRLNVRNDAADPLQVIVKARSPKLTFPEGDKLVELRPAGVTEVVIPVEARANGTSSIEVLLVTPELEVDVEGPVVLTARVNALTGLGQVITGGAVIVLLSWWFSHFRRRRRARLALANGAAPVLANVSPDAAEAIAGDVDH